MCANLTGDLLVIVSVARPLPKSIVWRSRVPWNGTIRGDECSVIVGGWVIVNDPKPAPQNAAEKTIAVLEAAMSHPRFTDIVQATGFTKPSVHRILKVLTDHGFLVSHEPGTYLPGPRALALAGVAFERIDIADIAHPFLKELSVQTGCQVHLGAANGFEAIYVAVLVPAKPYRMPSRVGGRLILHATSIGKALMEEWPEERVAKYVEESGLVSLTPHTIITLEGLLADLELVRQRGYSLDDEEHVPGIRCIGAPIRNHLGVVSHAVSVSTLSLEHDLKAVENFAPQALAAAEEISRALGYRGEIPQG
jgi:DNA-binding IclR family transcriptional regulator